MDSGVNSSTSTLCLISATRGRASRRSSSLLTLPAAVATLKHSSPWLFAIPLRHFPGLLFDVRSAQLHKIAREGR